MKLNITGNIIGMLVIFAMLCITASVVSAQADDNYYESLGVFKQYECVTLIQTCANCTMVNISSVTYPNSTIALGQVEMIKSGTFYYYDFCKTDWAGTYRVNGYGDIDYPGIYETFTYTFDITPQGGAENSTTTFLFLLIISIAILMLGYIFHNYIFATVSGFGLMATGVYGIIYGFGDITNQYTRIISFVVIGLGMIISITSSFQYIDEMYGGEGKASKEEDDD